MLSVMHKNKKGPGEGLTLAQMQEKLLATGQITREGLTKARAELDADAGWQAFLATQPQAAAK